MTIAVLVLVLMAIVGLLIGWLVPAAFKSKPPYGLAWDLIASVVTMLVFGAVEWFWLLGTIGLDHPIWLKILIALTDPAFGAAIVLWIMRRVKG
jgi:uncharacterized membrane protein YeaQ/YmgE (transglycosylase-associated protein family)